MTLHFESTGTRTASTLVGPTSRPSRFPPIGGNVGPPNCLRSDRLPVRNRSFRDWQIKHQQGGDFIANSDVRWVNLNTPIRVQL
ncbi:DUF6402 family protein [Variovorax soli]|uniref:DUF6402 family protein n=1 Tax=Variovorax soli TaxID=376815 RepID=UPI0009FEEF1F|nr:DUF6402 family protein [Variovorax soli]